MATHGKKWWIGAVVGVLLAAGCGQPEDSSQATSTATSVPAEARVSPDGYPERWNYIGARLADDKGGEEFIERLRLSKANGCTHILMPEGRSMRFADDSAYLARVAKIKAAAKDLKLTLVPSVISIGYSGRYFHYDANLAAGLPVKDAVFAVQGGKATPDVSMNPDISGLTADVNSVAGTIPVRPFHHYKVTFRLAGESDPREGDREAYVQGRSSKGMRNNCLTNAVFEKDGDGWKGTTTFNSLEGDQLRFTVNGQGRAVSDLKIVSAGLLLIVRRDLVPLTVTSEDGKTVYEEGRDFEKIVDPCLKINPYHGETTNTHAAAELALTKDSRIQEGEKLKLSFWHTVRIYDDQDCISLEDPRTHEIYENEFKNCHKVWGATSYFINYDEIRIGGWEPLPDGRKLKPGELLAEHFKKSYDMVRKHAPGCTLYTWSDMFTPYHNARPFANKGYYYLVNGNYDNAWLGVPKDVTILNWYAPETQGVKFFADLGYKQVLCGYYDVKSTEDMTKNIDRWKNVSAGQPGILGFMYTTWSANYKHLEEYFKLVDARKLQTGGAEPTGSQAEPGVPAGH